ncbi:serine/threonine-protein kinase [Rubricoccus marinus]|uniref:Protein kinase domain-containing protein n=1 Tax=Rubricoccus marinus TaxID=716817 RepID=A0A259TVL3_9BACT|nr:serine/threonine-protein kinase [Rubricoccus marinus]OZC01805.1 hypothetical protein BSZ36_01660 [Rubricoccus marinus]
MDATNWTRLDAELARALDLDGEERAAHLASLDPDLRAEIERMLEAALADDPLLDHPEGAVASLGEEDAASGVNEGHRVGPYEIEEMVGEGGMGRVYRARRADGAYDKTVAVKVVRRSLTLAGSDVAARLRRERELLAALDHPGIARLVDGGETSDGVPYLVTEFIEGEPVTDYADARGLGVRERVRLVSDVALAVDHAHRRFVVHRDLKPSNVLVSAQDDGTPRPVVLDFGIAKLVDASDEASGAFPLTQTGMRLLTPAYAAPELYDPGKTVTTAVDVYGLGALLYELLTGRRPHGDGAATGPPTAEPTRPSRIVTETAGEGPLADASTRSRALRGDLDTICLKALHPDPARRYASAADLADDLARYLDGRPVEARPDSLAYVAGRFARRNRGIVAAAAVAVLALTVGLGSALVSLSNEREAFAEATASADRAGEAARLLRDLFGEATPEAAAGRGDVTIREALDRGLDRIGTVEPASLRGYLLTVLGSTYLDIGDFERGDSLLLAAAELLKGEDVAPSVRALNLEGLAYNRGFRGDHRGALPLVLRADSLARLETRIDSSLAFEIALTASATYRGLQQPGEALEWAETAERLVRASAGPTDRGRALTSLARAQYYNEQYDEAIDTSIESVAYYEAAEGKSGPSLALAMSQTAHHLLAVGRLEDAIPYSRRAVAIARDVYGPDHHERFLAMGLLGQLLQTSGETAEAEAYLDSTVTIAQALPSAQTATGMSMAVSLAQMRKDRGDYRGTERAGRIALRIREQLPPEATRLGELDAMARLLTGVALHKQGRPGARALLNEAFDVMDTFEPELLAAWREDPFIGEAERALRSLGGRT